MLQTKNKRNPNTHRHFTVVSFEGMKKKLPIYMRYLDICKRN